MTTMEISDSLERVDNIINMLDEIMDHMASGIHWRSGVIVTAEERLESDGNIKVTLPGGRLVEASLVGRDPTADVRPSG